MRHLTVAAALLILAGCVAAPEGPPPAPPTRYAPPPAAPLPPPPAATSDWRDWPLTPGDWSYGRSGAGSVATFGRPGQPLLTLTCAGDRQLRLARNTAGGGAMIVRTSSTARTLPTGAASLAASDPLIDAMGFSRGRFVIEQPGAPTLVVPAWAEILRVAEDCRG